MSLLNLKMTVDADPQGRVYKVYEPDTVEAAREWLESEAGHGEAFPDFDEGKAVTIDGHTFTLERF